MRQRSVLWLRGLLVLLLMATLAPAAHAQAPSFNSNFGTYSVGQVEVPLSASGPGPITWSVAGSLPPGMALRTDGAVWFAPPTLPGLSGVATTPGTYTFSLSATNASGMTTQPATIKITSLTILDFWQLPDAFVGQSYSYTFSAPLNNVSTPTWTLAPFSNPLPGGITFTGGVLAGTPSTAGYYNVTVQLSDGVDTIYRSMNFGVYAISITSSGPAPGVLPNAVQNAVYAGATLTASGGTGPYTFTANSLPTGLSLDPSGTISGTPTSGPGKYSFTISATDSSGPPHVSYSKPMSLDVLGVPVTLPAVNPQGFGSHYDDCTLGYPCSRGVSVNSGGTAPFTWTASGLPPGMSFRTGSGVTSPFYTPGDLELSGTPVALGTFSVQVTVTDAGGLSATNTFPLKVSRLLQTEITPGGTINVAYNARVRIIGGTGPYSVAQAGGQLPLGLSFPSGAFAGSFFVSGTPVETGGFSIDYTHSDSAGNSLRQSAFLFIGGGTSTININTFYDLGTTTQGVSYSNQLSACCVPSPINWTLDSGSLPPGVTLSLSGLLSGTPSASGTYLFVIRAADSTNAPNAAVRQFKLVVTPLSVTTSLSLPYGNVSTAYPTVGGAGVSLVVSGGAGPYTWSIPNGSYLPPGLTLSAGGSLSGVPTASGFYIFTLTATDSATPTHNTISRVFSVSIYPVGVNPPLTLSLSSTFGPFAVGQDTIQLTGAAGGQPPYHFSLTPLAPAITGMRVQDGAPLPTNFPSTTTAGFVGVITSPGSYNASIRVTDSATPTSAVFDKSIALTVSTLASLSQFNVPKATVGVPYSFTLTSSPSSGVAWSVASGSSLPNGLTLSSGVISGTPTTATSSTNSVSLTLTDLSNLSNHITISITLVVNPFAITTNGVLLRATAGSSYSQTFASGCASSCSWSISSGSSPSGLSLNSSTGVLSGTVSSGSTFNGSFTVQVSGSNGTVQKVFSLQVMNSTPQALSITTTSIGDVTVGNTAQAPLSAQGGTPPYSWSFVSGALPPGVAMQGPGETLSSTLNPGFSYLAGRAMQTGSYGFTVSVTDSAGTPATVARAFTWNISPLALSYSSLPLSGTTLVYNTAYTQPLLAIGGTGHYTWSSLDPMPAGLSLNASTGVVSGTPSDTGFFNVRIQVIDDQNQSIVSNLSFNIAGPTPTLVNFGLSANIGVVQQGFAFSRDLSPSGGTGPYTISLGPSSALPPGFAIETGSAVLANLSGSGYFLVGTPLATGTFTFTLIATDSALPTHNIGARTFTLTVSPLSIFTSATLADASVSQPYTYSLVAWNTAGATTWTMAAGSTAPPGLTLSTAGVLSGTPTTPGNYNFTATATDSSTGLSVSSTFSLKETTLSINGSQTLPTAIVGTPYTDTFTASGGGASRTWSAPQGIPFPFSLSSGGVLTGTPTGPASVTFLVSVTDGSSSVTRRVALAVQYSTPSELTYPVSLTALPDGIVGQSFSSVLAPSGGVAPYSWSVAAGSLLPPGLSLIPTATFASPLTSNFAPGSTIVAGAPTAAGDYTFDLIVSDSAAPQGQTRRTFTLHVSSIAVLSGGLKTVTTGSAYNQQFTVTGGTGPYTFSMTPVSLSTDMLPPGLALSPSTGLLSGTTTSTGNYSFVLHVHDNAGLTFARTYSLTVNTSQGLRVNSTNPNDCRVGINCGNQSLFASDNNNGAAAFTWSVSAGSLPPGMQLVVEGGPNSTSLEGVPSVAGTYQYTLRATEASSGNTADHRFTFKVGAMQTVSPAVQLAAEPLLAGEVLVPFSTMIKIAGAAQPYSFAESPFAPLPSWLVLEGNGVLHGTPPLQSNGSYGIQPIITDANGSIASSTLTLVVTPAGAPVPLIAIPAGDGFPAGSVGMPFSFPLDGDALRFLFSGGEPPYTWSVASGSLPPGLTIYNGHDGVPSYLAGVPSAAGEFDVQLTVSDARGQSAVVPVGFFVFNLALTPDALPPGVVGNSYSVSLTASGGTGPYTFALSSDSDLPAGLTLSPAGVLSGTPTAPGNFGVFVIATDSLGQFVFKVYPVTIDNAAGEAPAMTLAPRAVQIDYVIGSPAPAAVPLAVNTTSGAGSFSAAVFGMPSVTLSSSTGTTPGGASLTLDVSSATPGTYVGLVGVHSPQAANRLDAVPLIVTIEAPPPCSYSLSAASGTVLIGGGTGAFSIGTSSLCSWTATPSDSWITITSAASGTGAATISYSVASNPTTNPRSGTITVNGQVYTITEFGTTCSFAITPSTLSTTAAGGNALISITPSNAICGWTASSASTLGVSPSSGTGAGQVTITIPPNAVASTEVLTALIAGQTLTVNEAGTACTVSLSAASASSPAGGGSGTVGVNTPVGCSYSTVAGPSWISVVGGSGIGSGTLSYSVVANSTTSSRSGTLFIGGQPFLITQDGLACSVTIDTSGLGSPFGSLAGAGTIGVAANAPTCGWTASSDQSWVAVTPGSGAGSATLFVNVAANTSLDTRVATLTIGGQPVQVSQSPIACSYSLVSSTGAVTASGGGGSVGVAAPAACTWTAASNSSWLTLTATGASGSSSVQFVAQFNPSSLPRTGSLTVADQTYIVSEAGAACSYVLSSTGNSVAQPGATDSFGFSTSTAGCTPAAVSYASWIAATTSFSGTSGAVQYTVAANPNTTTRQGAIQVGDQIFTVTQSGGACGYSLNAYGALFSQAGGSGSVLGSPTAVGCNPASSIGTDQPTIITLGPLTGPVLSIFTQPYAVSPFSSLTVAIRRATITFGGQIFVVKQTSW